MYEEFFCQRLAKLRNLKDVSAREMSLSIGQSAGYINSIENQKSMPSMASFFYICEYLGVTPGEFFDEDNPCPEALRHITQALRELTPEQIEHLEYIARQMKKKK